MFTEDLNLQEIEAFVFDAFGTTVDWFTTVTREVARQSHGLIIEGSQEAINFAREWRAGYTKAIHDVSEGKGDSISLSTDIMHRNLLDTMLQSPRWSHLASIWGETDRNNLTMIWHHLDGVYHVLEALTELRKHKVVVTLSNGNFRLLLDMAKHAHLPWDAILSAEMFGVYKPGREAYIKTAYHLSVEPHKIAMVAAHRWDLRGAANAGLKTIYVPRPAEDTPQIKAEMKTKKHGGEVDLIVGSFGELVKLVTRKN
ncbi:HAD-like domain-containing protein [Hygrophoropsis aurantiaca]|uniref:HAD-like domain-containing protein n=1 Tax=Hygrophoropsis aurantiaca TaxID=72124 RepID=A0ACB8A4B6_9AGAM|nr:HAD-like domain-containing protein [Hygrophoropsis aurantiaca]